MGSSEDRVLVPGGAFVRSAAAEHLGKAPPGADDSSGIPENEAQAPPGAPSVG